jgi:hypothetical protein
VGVDPLGKIARLGNIKHHHLQYFNELSLQLWAFGNKECPNAQSWRESSLKYCKW